MPPHGSLRYFAATILTGALLCCAACADEHREDLQFSDAPPENALTVPETPRHETQFSTTPAAQQGIMRSYTTPPTSSAR